MVAGYSNRYLSISIKTEQESEAMRFLVAGKAWQVDFEQKEVSVQYGVKHIKGSPKQVVPAIRKAFVTTVTVTVEDVLSPMVASTVCHPMDEKYIVFGHRLSFYEVKDAGLDPENFPVVRDAVAGQILALKKALEMLAVPRSIRGMVWKEFHQALKTRLKVVADESGNMFVQAPIKRLVAMDRNYRRALASCAEGIPVALCPLPMDHPYFLTPEKFGLKELDVVLM